jgi:ribonuclease HII
MNKAIRGLGVTPGTVLIDGPYPIENDAPCYAVVRGDQTSLSIAAASIIAKTARDQIMRELANEFPLYGFEIHKGYGTAHHIEQLKRYGPCSEHRYSCGLVLDAARVTIGNIERTIVV